MAGAPRHPVRNRATLYECYCERGSVFVPPGEGSRFPHPKQVPPERRCAVPFDELRGTVLSKEWPVIWESEILRWPA